MLRLIEGGFYYDAKGSMTRDILSLVNQKKPCLLVVPEQQRLTAEREMVKLLPAFAPLCFEVTNFSRFANGAFRTLGGVSKEHVDRTKRMLVMWQTLSVLSPALYMSKGRREINTGIVDKAVSAVVKMQSASVESEDLAQLLSDERLSNNRRLCGKVSDLSMIMSLYKKTLKEKYNETGDDVSLLASALTENPDYLADTDIFFEGFTSFTEPQYKLIGILAKRARVHILLTLPKLFRDSVEYAETALAEKRLKSIAKKANTEIQICRVDAPGVSDGGILRGVGEILWQSFLSIDYDSYGESAKEALRVFEAKSPYDACEFIGADIRRRVMNGARYRDFAIICRDTEEYSGILASSLSSYNVPAFISESRDIADFEAVKLINSAYKAILHDFEAQDVLAYAKCSICGISRDACDEFEEYIYTWQLNKKRFTDGILWNMSPRGLTAVSEADRDALVRINETRRSVIEPLVRLLEQSRDCTTVFEFANALYSFLTSISLESALQKQSEELLRIGEESLSEDTGRLWKIICDSLDTLVDTVGELKTSKEGFLSLLSIAFSSAKISKIPAHSDEVTIGSADMIRLCDKKHVYLLGVNSGEFPRQIKDNAYFSEREKLTLSEMGLSLMPENELEYSRELFSFSRAFSYAEESVTLIYSKAMRDFSKCERAPIIDRICEICEKKLKIQKISDMSALDFIYTHRSALLSLGKLSSCEYESLKPHLKESVTARLLEIADTKIENNNLKLSAETVGSIYKGDIGLSQSRLERYNSCPLSYFCSYNLGLKTGERAKFDARNIGSFIHSILENFFREVKERKIDLKTLDKSDVARMVNHHAQSYVKSISALDTAISTARTEVMINRLTAGALPVVEGLCAEFRDCDYVPTYFELDIGKSKTEISPSAVKYTSESGRNVYVAGVIDRVDTFKSDGDVYVRVVDYKTGQKEFSPSDIDEGENLQMFLYLKAVCDTKNEKFREDIGVAKDGKLIPAGVIYVKTDLSDISIPTPDEALAYAAFHKKQTRKGMLLDDQKSIDAMNKGYIPVRYTKDNEPDKRTAKNLYTLDGWSELSRRVEDSVLRICRDMESGNISSAPKKSAKRSPCEYCQYKPICRHPSVK